MGKDVVYTAIPKYLVYANLHIGAYVENRGYAVTTPWQYTYGMADLVDYDSLKESLNTLAIRADEIWVFAENAGFVPDLEERSRYGLGLTDGVDREVTLAKENDVPVLYFHIDAESLEIEKRGEWL